MLEFSKESPEAKNRTSSMMWAGVSHENDTERLWRESVSGCYIEKHLNMSARQGVLTYTLETLRQDGYPGTYKRDEIADMV